MTISEQKVLVCGVGAGTPLGLALGLMTALIIALKPRRFALVR